MLLDDRALAEQAARLEALLSDIESLPDPAVRAGTVEIVQRLLELYGEGLTRMLTIVDEQDDAVTRDRVLEAFAQDELVAHLLLLHDLHPVSLATRVSRALEEVRPYLQSHGGNVELLGLEGGVARLRLQGSCSGCPSSTITLKLAIEEALHRAAPDLNGIETEGVVEPPPQPVAFLPASELLKGRTSSRDGGATWTSVGGLPDLAGGSLKSREVAGLPLLFVELEGTLYAYRDACPNCAQPLHGGVLTGADLACPGCRYQYDIRRAGRCLDSPAQTLEPVPLLVQNEEVKIAL